jgi:hypothetical protein
MNDCLTSQVGFALGTGRCGTKFLAKVVDLEPQVAACHERNPLNETFHRYCKWYGLPVDHEGFLQTKADEITADLTYNQFSFESSAFLALSIQELYERFDARFILLVRSPEKVVNSYLQKGWYEKPIVRADPNLPPSYQESRLFHHFLGRIIPSGDAFLAWNQLSRVGKLAWYWNTLNTRVLEQFQQIPTTHWRVVRLEDMSYAKYDELAQFLGFKSAVTPAAYATLTQKRPNAFSNVPQVTDWSKLEQQEFEAEVVTMADYFGYSYRVTQLVQTVASPPMVTSSPPLLQRLSQVAIQSMKRAARG